MELDILMGHLAPNTKTLDVKNVFTSEMYILFYFQV